MTHLQDPEAAGAFRRLRREAARYGAVYCACHGAARLKGVGRPIRIDDEGLRAALPSRWREWRRSGSRLNDFIDLLHLCLIRRLPGFDDYWFVEYDVDFSGSWDTLFSAFEGCTADLLGTTIHPRADDLDWYFWPGFQAGEDASAEHHARGFFPVVRLSRRFADTYAAEVERGWSGHFEALYPTLARAHGLTVEDIGGEGPLAPNDRRGRFYSNTFRNEHLFPGSFRFQPPVASHYYAPGAVEFPRPDFLWHPIKTAATREGAKGP